MQCIKPNVVLIQCLINERSAGLLLYGNDEEYGSNATWRKIVDYVNLNWFLSRKNSYQLDGVCCRQTGID